MISKKKKITLCEFQNFCCEECKLKKAKKLTLSELEIHRINPELGYENHRNLKVLCKAHHKIFSSAQRISSGVQGR